MNLCRLGIPFAFSVPFALAAARGVGAQADGFPPDVARIVATARAQGLPAGSILTKAAQGMQLHKSPELIVSVVQQEATRLSTARGLLGAGAADADLQTAAAALSYNIPGTALVAIRRARPIGSVAVPLGVLIQLVVEGDPVAAATTTVVGVMRRGVTDPQLLALRDQIDRDVANGGMSIESAADLRFRGLTAALPSTNTGALPADLSSLTSTAPSTAGATTTKPPGGTPPIVKRPPLLP
jgi:hypothetical protein